MQGRSAPVLGNPPRMQTDALDTSKTLIPSTTGSAGNVVHCLLEHKRAGDHAACFYPHSVDLVGKHLKHVWAKLLVPGSSLLASLLWRGRARGGCAQRRHPKTASWVLAGWPAPNLTTCHSIKFIRWTRREPSGHFARQDKAAEAGSRSCQTNPTRGGKTETGGRRKQHRGKQAVATSPCLEEYGHLGLDIRPRQGPDNLQKCEIFGQPQKSDIFSLIDCLQQSTKNTQGPRPTGHSMDETNKHPLDNPSNSPSSVRARMRWVGRSVRSWFLSEGTCTYDLLPACDWTAAQTEIGLGDPLNLPTVHDCPRCCPRCSPHNKPLQPPTPSLHRPADPFSIRH